MSLQSVYSAPYQSNLPARDASQAYAYPYMTERLPQATFPWDAARDSRYQADIANPNYRHYGNNAYPYSVRRQQTPVVFYNPRPKEYDAGNGFTFNVPEYPPPIYWYPNPVECEDACGAPVCNAYYRRLNNYRMCQVCQSLKRPMCWDPQAQQCVGCTPEHALDSCEDRFGSRNPNGWMHSNVGPINPKYTGCLNSGL